ncbi:MAG: squalene/phytoene synthase family protein [Acidobacteriota bacterium]
MDAGSTLSATAPQPRPGSREATAKIAELLTLTSRTFALSIPLLPSPTDAEVGLAYLLFRIADTFEDSVQWPAQRKMAALDDFAELLQRDAADPETQQVASRLTASWAQPYPDTHEGYNQLLDHTPLVLAQLHLLEDERQPVIVEHTVRTCVGMKAFVERTDAEGRLTLEDVDDLRHYCYIVAGIVGEMLTELFLAAEDHLAEVADSLRAEARAFGEGLQLVNILKDSAADAVEGRFFLPAQVPREQVFELARGDLERAQNYVETLRHGGAHEGVVGFCALPVLLARASLQQLEQTGPGAKISREQVFELTAGLEASLRTGTPIFAAP